MGLRERRLGIVVALHAAVLALGIGAMSLGALLDFQPLFDGGGLLVLADALTFQRLPLGRLLQQRLLLVHQCSQCRLEIELVRSWRCGCGFSSQGRHAFSPCPQCGKGFAWINCPRCDTGILI